MQGRNDQECGCGTLGRSQGVKDEDKDGESSEKGRLQALEMLQERMRDLNEEMDALSEEMQRLEGLGRKEIDAVPQC